MNVRTSPHLKAVILAAGNGHRLVTPEKGIPKPLCRVAGRTLLDRVMDGLAAQGIRHFVVVVGHLGERIVEHLEREPPPKTRVDCVWNPDFNLGNGLSVLAASPKVSEPFVLTMSDHLFDPSLLERLLAAGREPEGVSLAVDRKLGAIFDLSDAMKARVSGERVVRLGKNLTEFDAIDTGLFFAGPALFEALEACRSRGLYELADGVNRLASQARVRAVDIGSACWIDVDTPEALAWAESRACRGTFCARAE